MAYDTCIYYSIKYIELAKNQEIEQNFLLSRINIINNNIERFLRRYNEIENEFEITNDENQLYWRDLIIRNINSLINIKCEIFLLKIQEIDSIKKRFEQIPIKDKNDINTIT